jgi:CubicO group peptidase (beta-lactamase class C family)
MPPDNFFYCNRASHLLSAIVTRATGMPTQNFARANLFEPLDITDWVWKTDPQGVAYGGWLLALTPRDMAKIGQLYLNGGLWNGAQVVPPDWVTAASSAQVNVHGDWIGNFEYGYQWWARPDDGVFAALRYGGQMVFVAPHLNLIAAFTAAQGDESTTSYNLFNLLVLPAARPPDG